MDTKKLAIEGEMFTHKKEKNILTSIRLKDMLQDSYETIGADKKLGDLVNLIRQSKKNIFAVVDKHEKFVGVIELNDIKQQIFQPELFESTLVKMLLKKPPAVLQDDLDMHTVMERFDITQSWYLPVLDHQKRFLGFVSKTKLFSKYREILSSNGDLYD